MATSIRLFSTAIIALILVGALFLAGCPQGTPAPNGQKPVPGKPVTPPKPIANVTENITIIANLTNDTETLNSSINGTIAPNETSNETINSTAPSENLTDNEPKKPERTITSSVLADPLNGRMRSKICSVELTPNRIYSGQEVSVKLYAHSANNERVTFLCGEEERSQGQGGVFQDQRQCVFNGVGKKRVWLALDGQVCASAPLEIIEQSVFPKPVETSCGIIPSSETSGFVDGLRTYQAKLELYGYPTSANLTWSCPPEKFTRPLSDFTTNDYGASYLVITCQYDYDPGQILSIPVSINDNSCGDLIPAIG